MEGRHCPARLPAIHYIAMIDVGLLNYVVNQPEVLKHVAPGRGRLDCAPLDDPDAHLFGDAAGLVLFRPADVALGLYEMHYLFTEAKRGKAALDLIRESITTMFTCRGATAICGAVPRDHMASRVMSRALGARPYGPHTDNAGRSCILYVLERKSWAISSAVS